MSTALYPEQSLVNQYDKMSYGRLAPEGKNIIYAAKGSFAEAFAQSHGMEFVVE